MEGQVTETSHSNYQPQLWMIVGRSVLEKFDKMTRRSEWKPHRKKFFEKSFQASLSRNQIEEKVGSEEDDAPKRREFWDRADLRFGAIDTLT